MTTLYGPGSGNVIVVETRPSLPTGGCWWMIVARSRRTMIRWTPVCGPGPRLNCVERLAVRLEDREDDRGRLPGRTGSAGRNPESMSTRAAPTVIVGVPTAASAAAREQADERTDGEYGRKKPGTVTPMWMLPALAVAVLAAPVPTPIGVGPLYHPPAHGPGAAAVACRDAPLRQGLRVHLELFAHKRVVIVPAGVGVRGASVRLGNVVGARCRAQTWTVDPTGVVRFGHADERLGTFFTVWSEPLSRLRLAGFQGAVSVFVNGARRNVDPRRLLLHDGDEIVLEVGGYVPPHVSFRFPPDG